MSDAVAAIPGETSEITRLLERWRSGEREAERLLMPLVYGELHRLARSALRHERREHTLQPTALLHEAYLQLTARARPSFECRAQFFGFAAHLMRRILVLHARSLEALKRGSGRRQMPAESAEDVSRLDPGLGVLELDEVLSSLAEHDSRMARIVELRVFGSLTIRETAEQLGIPTITVNRSWRRATAWLCRSFGAPVRDGA